jgi:hypothetical protein
VTSLRRRLEVAAHRDHVTDARRLRIDRDVVLRPSLGAILPLHDVKYRAWRIKPRGLSDGAMTFSADESEFSAGGARRNRTDDLLLAKQALSQLSYGPSRYRGSEASIREERARR